LEPEGKSGVKMRVRTEDLARCSKSILTTVEVPDEDADIIVDSILYAHIRGKHTHGIGRMPIYVRKINEGLMNPKTPMTVIADNPATAVYDAENGFGQVAAIRAMDSAIEKAKMYGIGAVGVRNSNNFGTAGFIGEYAVEKGLIGIVLANSGPAIAPTGGNKAILGTNPICVAFPSDGTNPPIIFDMACSNAARGKIRLAAKNGEKIPLGWAVDENGKETDDPNEALKGTMMPIGGYKGFGLALCVDILAGMMTGSAFGGAVKNLNHPTEISRYGHMIVAINPAAFLPEEEYKEKLTQAINNIKACGDEGEILLPGEKSYRSAQSNMETVEIGDKLVSEFNELIQSVKAGEQLKERK